MACINICGLLILGLESESAWRKFFFFFFLTFLTWAVSLSESKGPSGGFFQLPRSAT